MIIANEATLLDFDGFCARDLVRPLNIESIFSQGKSSGFIENFSENSPILLHLFSADMTVIFTET